MQLHLVAFGIAKEILGQRKLSYEAGEVRNVGELLRQLGNEYPDFRRLATLRVAVNEAYVQNDYVLQPGDELVLIPPVSGG
jgi:molybdopterin converting factor small subunit